MTIESVNLFPKPKFATTVIVILSKTSERERLSLGCFTASPKLFFSPVSDLRNHDIRGKPGEWEEDIQIW